MNSVANGIERPVKVGQAGTRFTPRQVCQSDLMEFWFGGFYGILLRKWRFKCQVSSRMKAIFRQFYFYEKYV